MVVPGTWWQWELGENRTSRRPIQDMYIDYIKGGTEQREDGLAARDIDMKEKTETKIWLSRWSWQEKTLEKYSRYIQEVRLAKISKMEHKSN